MKTFCFFLSLLVACVVVGCVTGSHATRATTKAPVARQTIPAPTAGVSELKFSEFFVNPVGRQGLTFTDKLIKLDGQRVRMLGYMVRREIGLPGQFLFAALPVQLHDHDSSDDLPAALVHVSVPTCRDAAVPHAPGLMLLTGTLSVGPREEADGRMSVVRLALDPPAASPRHFSNTSKGGDIQSARAMSPR